MSSIAKGTFEVKLLPLAFEGQPEGSKLGRMSIDKEISGDLVATTKGQMLSAFGEVKGSAGYVAIERVEGALHGRPGGFVLQHTGTMDQGSPSLRVTVVPDSGTGALAGLAGEFKIIPAEGKHRYEFNYTHPEEGPSTAAPGSHGVQPAGPVEHPEDGTAGKRHHGANAFPIEGGCACKAVRYRMESTPLFVHCCHCRWCQRETGASFALNAMIEADRVTNLGVEPDVVNTPTESGLGQQIARCPRCRIAVWSHYAGAGPVVKFVRVGTLDNPDVLPPDIHIFTQSRQPWVALQSAVPAVPEYYDRDQYWPPESLARRREILPAIEAHQRALKK